MNTKQNHLIITIPIMPERHRGYVNDWYARLIHSWSCVVLLRDPWVHMPCYSTSPGVAVRWVAACQMCRQDKVLTMT